MENNEAIENTIDETAGKLCTVYLSQQAIDYLFSIMNGAVHTNGDCDPYAKAYAQAVRHWNVTEKHGKLHQEVMGQLVNAYPDFTPDWQVA